MAACLAQFENALHELEHQGRRRSLSARAGIDFSSNDYLALAESPRLKTAVLAALERGVPIGAGGSRLLRGNHPEHEALEAEAAAFFRAERALFFGSGYAANVAILSALPQKSDLVVYDELVHASSHDGIALGRSASIRVAHNDANAVEDRIRAWRCEGGKGVPWIVVESLYSMDGDRAPLADLLTIADRHDAVLVVDEAHATGTCGVQGRGLTGEFEGRENLIVLHTCGKAMGVAGALVCASHILCDYLVNRARPFIYATAPAPLTASAVREALKVIADTPERRCRLGELIAFANAEFARVGLASSGSQILPVMIGDNARAAEIAARLQADGFDLRAIRPPTVQAGTARLRIAITLHVDEQDITAMVAALDQALTGDA